MADTMQERVIQFRQAIVAISEEDGAMTEEDKSDDGIVVVDNTVGTSSNSTLILYDVSTTDEYAQLMSYFQAILSVTSDDNILSKVLPAAPCLERKYTVSGALSFERKSKSLLGHWIGNAVDSGLGNDDLSNNEIVIERETILLVHSKFGTGATAAILSIHLCIVNIYE